jgi:hypothetical protein
MSALGQKRTHALQQNSVSIGSPRRRGRAASAHGKAERLGGLEVDDQLDFYCLLDRQVGGLVALENPARMLRRTRTGLLLKSDCKTFQKDSHVDN